MACRLFLRWKRISDNITKPEVTYVVFGVKNMRQKPAWWRDIAQNLYEYDPHWSHWTEEEKQFVKMRLMQGIDPTLIKTCLEIPDDVYRECTDFLARKKIVLEDLDKTNNTISESSVDEEVAQVKELSSKEIFEQKMLEYGQRIDITNPVNRATVMQMVVLESKLESLNERLIDTDDLADLEKLTRAYATLREQYSRSAEDVALLAKQKDIINDGEAMDDLYEVVLSELPKWRDTNTEILLEELGLIKHMVALHKVDLYGVAGNMTLTSEHTGNINKVPKNDPHIRILESGGGDESLAVESGD